MPRVVRVHQYGGPEQLVVEDLDVPLPTRGDVRLRHEAIGVNFVDCYHRSGLYPLPSLPHGIGSEGVGVVEQLGDGVQGVQVGDRVAYAGVVAPCSYAEVRNVPAWRLVHVPADLEAATVAAVLLKGLTAEFLVRRAFKAGPGHRALVHAAAGGVGLLLCQWLRHVGTVVFGTVSTAAKAELAAANGCHHPIVLGEEPFVDVVQRITQQKGVDVVYDSVGKVTLRDSLRCLRKRGMLVTFGNASGRPEPIDVGELQVGSFFVTRPTLGDYTATRGELTRAAEVLFSLVRGGVLRVRIDRTLPLAEAATAHRLLEGRQTMGSVVLVP